MINIKLRGGKWVFISIVKIFKVIRLIFEKIDVLNKLNDLKFIKMLRYRSDILSFKIKLNYLFYCVLEVNGETLFYVLTVFVFRDNLGV